MKVHSPESTVRFCAFAARHTTTVAGGEELGPQAEFHRVKPSSSNLSAGHRAAADRGTIIDHARIVVVKQIKELLGDDVKCWRLHKKYLDRLNFVRLCARRDLLAAQQLPMQLDMGPINAEAQRTQGSAKP